MNRQREVAAEDGFTLIELMISVSLLGLITGPIAVAMIFGIVHSNGTRDRVADSAAAQLVSTYLAPDVQSAAGVFTNDVGTCSSAIASGDVVRLRLEWVDPVDGTS